jgi:hypothetical protein
MEDLEKTVKEIEGIVSNISEQIAILENEVISTVRKDEVADSQMDKKCKESSLKLAYEVKAKAPDVTAT